MEAFRQARELDPDIAGLVLQSELQRISAAGTNQTGGLDWENEKKSIS